MCNRGGAPPCGDVIVAKLVSCWCLGPRRVQLTTSSVTQGLMTLSHVSWPGSMCGMPGGSGCQERCPESPMNVLFFLIFNGFSGVGC